MNCIRVDTTNFPEFLKNTGAVSKQEEEEVSLMKYEQQIFELKKDLNFMNESFSVTLRALRQEIEDLRVQNKKLQSELYCSTGEDKPSATENETYKTCLQVLRTQLEAERTKNSDLQNELRICKRKLESAYKKIQIKDEKAAVWELRGTDDNNGPPGPSTLPPIVKKHHLKSAGIQFSDGLQSMPGDMMSQKGSEFSFPANQAEISSMKLNPKNMSLNNTERPLGYKRPFLPILRKSFEVNIAERYRRAREMQKKRHQEHECKDFYLK